MKNKFAILAFIAVILCAVSCGNEKLPSESSVTLDLPAVTTEVTETTAEVVTTAKVTVKTTVISETTADTTAVTTETATEAMTEEVTEAPAEETTEPPATEPPATEPPVTEPPATEPPATEPPVQVQFSINNLDGDVTDIINSLGEPLDVQNATGCLSNGADQRIYVYDGLSLSCYMDGDTPYVYQIMITNSVYSTTNGITVGSSRSDVENAYGTGEESGNYVIYADGGKELDVQYDGDTVTSIVFYMAV